MIFIKDIKEAKLISSVFLVASVNRGVSSNGSQYLSIQFQDNTGKLEARRWGATDQDYLKIVTGALIEVTGEVFEYRNDWQMKIIDYRIIDPVAENIDISNFIACSPISKEELFISLEKYISQIKDPDIIKIVDYFYKKYQKELQYAPAASKVHHSYVTGLLHHIVSMLKLAESIINVYFGINKDLVYAGIFIHDLGKIKELSAGTITKYTLEGTLIGHISIIHAELRAIGEQLVVDKEKLTLLEHIILSHHNEQVHGSPIEPLTLEAIIVASIDKLDSSINRVQELLNSTKEKEFTVKDYFNNNKSYYKS